MHPSFARKPFALLASLACGVLAFAAPLAARADGDAAAGPGVGVARISLIQGSVAVQRGDSATASAAVINAPVLGADYVTTGDGSRAEVQFDAASAVRLGANVQMRFTHLDANDRELQLAEGTLDLRLLRGIGGRSQIDTPSISVRPRASGSYRVTVDANGATQVTVRSGIADVVTPQGAQALAPGTTLLAQGAASSPAPQRADAIALDDFDRFNNERDARELRALEGAYTSPAVAGADDLNTYGRWVNDPGYGVVWTPSVVGSNWAPYRDGRWVWEDAYGWTWIGYEPWGWAPYHYGRWYHSRQYGWCWYPASWVVPWSPALVAFVTFGGTGLAFQNIGWVPLAPFEPFYPWWGYHNNTTVVNVVNNNVTNNNYYAGGGVLQRPYYKNARHGGATEISKQRFLEGRFEKPVAVKPEHMRSVQPVRGPVPLVPSDVNLRLSDRAVAAPLAVRATTLQRTYAGDAVAVRRTPIEQQRSALVSITHAAPPPVMRSVTTTNAAPAATANAPAAPRDPWARFGTARGAPAAHVTVIDGAAPSTGRPAWNRFDAVSAARPSAAHEPAVVHEAPVSHATTRVAEPQRTSGEGQRTYPERHEAPPPAYAQPHQQKNSAPAAAPPAAQVNQPAAHANAPARSNPPPRSEPHTERSTQHHQR